MLQAGAKNSKTRPKGKVVQPSRSDHFRGLRLRALGVQPENSERQLLPDSAQIEGPPEAPPGVAASHVSVSVISSFVTTRGIALLAANCTAPPGGPFPGRSFAGSISVTDADAARAAVDLAVPASYSGPYNLSCSVRALDGLGELAFQESAGTVLVPAAPPGAPLELSVGPILTLFESNDANVSTIARFTAGQSVATVELACSGFGGPYAYSVAVTDADASGLSISLPIATFFNMSYDLSCSARVLASTSLASRWTAAAAYTVPGAFPWRPLRLAVVAINATMLMASVQFIPGQSVTSVEVTCSALSNMYATNGTAMHAGAASSVFNVSVLFVPGYSGSYELNCSARVRASTGLASEWRAAGSITVPAAAPSAPLEVTAVPSNASLAVVRVRFSVGQSVAAAEVECVGKGGPYSVNVATPNAAASSVDASVVVAASYVGSYELNCTARVRASTGLASEPVSAPTASVPPAPPAAPALLSVAALNSSLLEFRSGFRAGMNVTSLEAACAGFGGPYLARVAVGDAESAGANLRMPVSPSYAGNYTVTCSLTVVGVTGLSSPGVASSVLVLAANPWAPWDIALTAINETSLSVNLAAVFTTTPQYSAGYLVNCTFVVRATTGLPSRAAYVASSLPAAAPSAPSIASLAPVDASRLSFEIRFTAGQSVDRADLECAGAGGPYAASFAALTSPVTERLPVSVSEDGSWTASCQARVRSSAGRDSPWSAVVSATVPGIFLMKQSEISTSSLLVPSGSPFSTGVVFRSASGRSKFALFGRQPTPTLPAASGAVLVYDVGLTEWTEATAQAPFNGFGMQCAWDYATVVFCTGGYIGSSGNITSSAWAYSNSLEQWVGLHDMPVARANHCMTVFNRTLWVFGGVGIVGLRNDLISYDITSQSWGTEIRQGTLDVPRQASPSCARIDAMWYVAGASEGSTTITIHEVDLGWKAEGGRTFRAVGAAPRSSPSAAFRIGACQGYLYAAFADTNGTVLFLEPKDASSEQVDGLAYSFELPVLDGDCSSCAAMLFGVRREADPEAPDPQRSLLLSLSGTVPIAAAVCTYPSPGELPAIPFELLPTPAPAAPQPSEPASPTPSEPASPTPPPVPTAVSVEFWLSVPATREECQAYTQRQTVSSVSQGFSRILSTALRMDLDAGRVQIADVRCGSILFHVKVSKAATASSSFSAALPDAFILETIANLTRSGQLLMPGLDDRPVSAMFNASFAAGVQPVGAAAEALARGESISSSSSASGQPNTLVEQPAPTPNAARAAQSGGGGSPVGAAAGATAGAGVVALAIGIGFGVYWKRKRRARAAGLSGNLATADAPFYPFDSNSQASLLQTIRSLSTAGSDGSTPSVWIDLPASINPDLDLFGARGPTAAPSGSGSTADLENNADSKGLTLAQRAALAPPRQVPEAVIKSVREPVALIGEGAFGRVYSISLPEASATWLREDAYGAAGGTAGVGDAAVQSRMTTIKRAVKEVSLLDPEIAAREIHGARLQKFCHHPNVLRCEALFADRSKLYIVLPLANMSLSALLASRGVLPEDRVVSFAFQIASGMAYLHHELPRPVAHRDLKPQNILVFREDDRSDPTLRVGDFGISRHVETAKSLRGTLVYLPPETYTKNDPVKADVWAFGIILMEMATGGKPYGGVAISPEHLIRGQPFPRAAFGALQGQLRLLARSCLSKSPQQRPTFLDIRQTLSCLLLPPHLSPVAAGGEGSSQLAGAIDDQAVAVTIVTENPDPRLPSRYR
eukprot:tig00000145_g8805.t1